MRKVEDINIDDNQLIIETAHGDEKAFAQLLKKYKQIVFSTVYRYTGNYDCIEDLAQEVFIKVWRNAGKFKGKSKFSTWLYRIVINHCLNYNSKQKLNPFSLDVLVDQERAPNTASVEGDWDKKQRIVQIKQAIGELPDRQRIALVLAHYEHKSHEEIAQIMRLSQSAVHSLIFRARDTLKKKLKKLLE